MGIVLYNGFISLKNKLEESYATMDAYLKKRWDLIPNLVETVKIYVSHEKETLEAVIRGKKPCHELRRECRSFRKGENALASGLRSLFALSEAYPDLKANENFINLQEQLQQVENDVLQSRKYYNAVVKSYNTKRELFPHSIVASMMKLEKKRIL